MPTSDTREPADVEVSDAADVIVRPGRSGHGSSRRFHKPLNRYTDKPACGTRHQYDDDGWARKQRGVLGDQKTPCKKCYSESDAPDIGGGTNTKDCPLCGTPVVSVAVHLRNDCDKND